MQTVRRDRDSAADPLVICSVDGCEQKAVARGWCSKHWMRWRHHGSPDVVTAYDLTYEQRFWRKVDHTETCWLWMGAKRGDGYGAFQLGPKQIAAHRYSYQLRSGEIPEGMVVMHSCDVPLCVNPTHLRLGTHAENSADAARKGRKLPGSQNHQAKLTEGQVIEMRERYAAGGVTQRQLADAFEVSPALVAAIVARKAWRHVA